MPTLVLPPRYTSDTIAVGRAAAVAGWAVERLAGWRVPEWLGGEDVVLYGEPLFASVVAADLNVALLGPPFDWLPSLAPTYRRRDVRSATLEDARLLACPTFVKPADEKCFPPSVIHSGLDLPGQDVLPGTTPVLLAEPVRWEVEFRCFVLDRRVVTTSVYLRHGELAQSADGTWADDRTGAAREFAESVCSDPVVGLPPAVVVDVGLIEGRGWAVVEANAAWGSGIYGCDPSAVLASVQRSCVRADRVSENDRRWVINCSEPT
jgi:hypothetical protein